MSETSPEEDAWFEWKRACTIERCCPESAASLAAYARSRFRSKAMEICGSRAKMPSGVRVYCDDASKRPDLAWLELEGRLWRTRRESRSDAPAGGGGEPEGKVYKQWLFERAATEDDPVEFLQRYCTDILKTGAREICAMEGCDLRHLKKGRRFISLQRAVPGGGQEQFDQSDFLLAKANEGAAPAECARFAKMADEEAGTFFDETTHRERVALAAHYADLPIYTPAVLLSAGCGKSVLSKESKDLDQQIEEHLKEMLEGERIDLASEFVRQFHRRLLALAYEWLFSENNGEAPF